MLQSYSPTQSTENVLIAGVNERSLALSRKIILCRRLRLKLTGFIDTQSGKNGDSHPIPKYNNGGIRILGDVDQLQSVLRDNVIDRVIVSLPLQSCHSEIVHIICTCEEAGIPVQLMPDIFGARIARSKTSRLENVPLIDFYTGPCRDWKLKVKYALDFLLTGALLLSIAPIMAVIALLIKLTSEGPVLFKQVRVGYNGRRFTFYKFRTMFRNAEELRSSLAARNEVTGPVFKIKDDPRITRIGRFLRRYSLDELPQLLNVIRGDMSLVGPRPPIPEEVDQYDWRERRRLSVRPGITCIWQVSGRSDLPFDEWVKLDLSYIDHWSFGLDLKLLLKTLPAVLKGTGAY